MLQSSLCLLIRHLSRGVIQASYYTLVCVCWSDIFLEGSCRLMVPSSLCLLMRYYSRGKLSGLMPHSSLCLLIINPRCSQPILKNCKWLIIGCSFTKLLGMLTEMPDAKVLCSKIFKNSTKLKFNDWIQSLNKLSFIKRKLVKDHITFLNQGN